MQAILLAGGLGTRLRSVVSDRPKPMALIEGRPFMEYVVRGLARHGIADIIFAVGYKGSMVEEHFRDGSNLGIRASYDRGALLCPQCRYLLQSGLQPPGEVAGRKEPRYGSGASRGG